MHRAILRLALPNILSNISVPLLSSVDTMLMGHLSKAHLAALGIASMIFVFLYGNFNFLRMGTTGMTAQAFGRADREMISHTLYRALLLAFGSGLLLILLQNPILELGSRWMYVEPSYADKVADYFSIRIYAAPAALMLFVLMGWFFGLQNARYPLYITLFVNFVNILLSYWLVKRAGIGIEGAAYGTLAAQYAGLCFGFVMMLRYRKKLLRPKMDKIFQKEPLLAFFHINKNIFIRTVALTFVLAFFYAQSARAGEEVLAVMILLLQFMIWMSFGVDGFANAAESLTGRYYGGNDPKKFHQAIRYSLLWGGGLAVAFSLIYWFFGKEILKLYTDDSGLIRGAEHFLPLVALLPLISFWAFIWDGIFIGMTASVSMRNTILLSTALFMLLFYLSKGYDFSYALWINFMLFFAYRGLFQWWLFRKKGVDLR
ncbi:MAG: hypothetical protein B6D59_00805 [Campylobacteraceae bacterium 4484_4]|nr:MAG: hypothetical protein B6D59_00805 [Campylobacteraceae bacterium 4484_4]